MDISAVVELITQVGFPIACTCVLFYLLQKSQADHKEESEKWIEALNNNTNVMQEVIKKLGG